MISRRLTKTQKEEILEAYMAGDNTNVLAKKYSCTPNTINRTVKTLLSESEYTLLKKRRSQIGIKTKNLVEVETKKETKEDLKKSNPLISLNEKVNQESKGLKVNDQYHSDEFEDTDFLAIQDADDFGNDRFSEVKNNKNNQDFDHNFEEIAPLISGFDFDQENQKSEFEILNYESLPETVYMIVDKKVELDLQPISDLPEWSFLPEKELQRKAILLFSSQRSAKRICSRNQRVIKIPNTSVFKLSKSYLISKGITRLILEDSIIAVDD